jgi:putative ABC transport system ATP-binding protein
MSTPQPPVLNQSVIVEAQNLSKTYGADTPFPVHALRGVSFKISAGEFTAIMGQSGSGKSTLMNLLGCLDRPSEGRYLLAGEDVSQKSRRELAHVRSLTLGFIFQSFHLLPRLSAVENCELPLQYAASMPRRQQRERAEEVLIRVGLKDKLRRKPTELSGGQQQRVAIARALVNRPKLLLADEPTGNLDTRTGLEVLALLQELNREGLTIAMVTHEPDVAGATRRTLLMRDGRLASDAINTHPADAVLGLQKWLASAANVG